MGSCVCGILYGLGFTPMRVLRTVGFAFIGIVELLAVLWLIFHKPSDAELKWRFARQQTDLSRLAEMMDQDWHMSRIAQDFTWRQENIAWPRAESESGISKQRWDEYRSIFFRTGLGDGTARPKDSSDIIVFAWFWGIVPAETSISYLHCGTPERDTVTLSRPASKTMNRAARPREATVTRE